jgi:hypothetical protein
MKEGKATKTAHKAEPVPKQSTSRGTFSRREILAGLGAVGAPMLLPGVKSAALDRKKTFTILHTNDIHSNFIGMSPESDYICGDTERNVSGGGPVLVLDRRSEALKG